MSPKRTEQPDRYEQETEIALFRYGLIAQLIHDPPDTGQQEKLLREVASKIYRIPCSKRTRVGVTTLRRYLKAYQEGGFEALRPTKRSDHNKPRAFSEEVLKRAIELREEQPERTTPMLVQLLKRDPGLELEQPINAHTLTTHLRQHGKTRRLLSQKTRPRHYTRFEREHANSLWQADAMDGPWLPDPVVAGRKRRTYLFCFLDDHSRMVPYAEFFWDEAMPRMERVLKVGILRRGIPKAIYVDNGKVYTANQFGAACATLGIQRILASPYAPEGKGKQERFFETLQLQLLPEVEVSKVTTLTALNESLWAWLECLYHQTVHSETGQTPLDRYHAGLQSIRTADPEQLRLAFLWREKRTVRKEGVVELQGNTYAVDPALRGQQVELRFDPFDLSVLDLYLNDRYLDTISPQSQNRQAHPQVERLVEKPAQTKQSIDFLALLRAEHKAMQRKAAGRLQFTKLPPDQEK
jgi:putative transposase